MEPYPTDCPRMIGRAAELEVHRRPEANRIGAAGNESLFMAAFAREGGAAATVLTMWHIQRLTQSG
jgi:hypothetical protein